MSCKVVSYWRMIYGRKIIGRISRRVRSFNVWFVDFTIIDLWHVMARCYRYILKQREVELETWPVILSSKERSEENRRPVSDRTNKDILNDIMFSMLLYRTVSTRDLRSWYALLPIAFCDAGNNRSCLAMFCEMKATCQDKQRWGGCIQKKKKGSKISERLLF